MKPPVPVDEIGPAIRGLRAHAGFPLLVERFEKEIEEVQRFINDEANGGKETRANKRALARLILARPETLAKDIFLRAKTQFDKAEEQIRR